MNGKNCGRWMAAGAALMLVAASAQAANIIKKIGGSTIEAKSIKWLPSSQEYRVETSEGIILPMAAKEVESLEIDKPADMDKAEQLIKGGQVDSAIPLLEGIISGYTMLVWDNKAREALARAHVQKKDPKKAANVMEEMIKAVDPATVTREQRRLYWDILLAADRTSSLKKELDEAIATAPRETAALAQLMRGNMNRAGGQKEDALLDYLRTVILFKDVKDAQPEALFKAAEMMDELRDPRAGERRKELLQLYPDSEWAKKAAGKGM
jgi:tetratricopeptide (TPR) repeat protein